MSVPGIEADTQTRTDTRRLAVDPERRLDGPKDPFSDWTGFVWTPNTGEDKGELVTTEPSRRIPLAYELGQPLSD